MSGSGNVYELRRWMYMHRDANGRVTKEYIAGLETFMHQADSTPLALEAVRCFVHVGNATIRNWQIVKMFGSI